MAWAGWCRRASPLWSWQSQPPGASLVRATQERQVWKGLLATGHTSSLLGTGHRVAHRPLPGLLHVSRGQRDPPSGQIFL